LLPLLLLLQTMAGTEYSHNQMLLLLLLMLRLSAAQQPLHAWH
jgi:hypothetical protein